LVDGKGVESTLNKTGLEQCGGVRGVRCADGASCVCVGCWVCVAGLALTYALPFSQAVVFTIR
jgi:hypothetical protein